jgi:hypothetical protein
MFNIVSTYFSFCWHKNGPQHGLPTTALLVFQNQADEEVQS